MPPQDPDGKQRQEHQPGRAGEDGQSGQQSRQGGSARHRGQHRRGQKQAAQQIRRIVVAVQDQVAPQKRAERGRQRGLKGGRQPAEGEHRPAQCQEHGHIHDQECLHAEQGKQWQRQDRHQDGVLGIPLAARPERHLSRVGAGAAAQVVGQIQIAVHRQGDGGLRVIRGIADQIPLGLVDDPGMEQAGRQQNSQGDEERGVAVQHGAAGRD